MNRSVRRAAGMLALVAALAPTAASPSAVRPLPPIVFVSRAPVPGDPLAVPGLGPHHRADAPGGRLMRRDSDGSLRELLPPGALFDVSDPSVSPDARTIVLAGTPHPDSAWRIWRCDVEGRGLAPVTRTATEFRAAGGRGGRLTAPRGDDLDPCWISDRVVCFASTCGAARSEYADVPVTNLFTVDVGGGSARQITTDRNGAEEPAYDVARGRIVYSRWWYNARMPSRIVATGVTRDRSEALGGDTVNVWQAVEIDTEGGGLRLAAGSPRPRRGAMGYQPCVFRDGDVVAVYALNTGLSPRSGPTGVHRLGRSLSPTVRLAGAVTDADDDPAYGTPRGLAATGACAPAALADGRLLLAYDAGSRGDYGISVIEGRDAPPRPVVDLPGTLELDPAPLTPWPRGARRGNAVRASADSTFTFFCRNLFATGPLDTPIDPPPAPTSWPLSIRFYEARPLAPTARGASDPGDTLVLVREGAVRPDGSIRETGLPAGVPLFEQIVDAAGLPLATAHGGTQVPGFNFGSPGAVVRCVGCHAGHSTLPADGPDARFRRIDVAPLAELSASSRAPGTAGPGAAADRRTRGDAARVAWVAAGDSAEWMVLAWAVPVRVDRVELWLPPDDGAKGTSVRLAGCGVELTHKGVLTRRGTLGRIAPGGAGLAAGGVYCDRLELRFGRAQGSVLGRRRVALAEVEVIGAFAPEGLNWPAGPRQAGAATPAPTPSP